MIRIEVQVRANISVVWKAWNDVQAVSKWAFASSDWGAEGIENDLRVGGRYASRMFARDGSAEFEFGGVYDEIIELERIAYTMDDNRKVITTFESNEDGTKIVQEFDPESENSEEMQRQGWQAILDNFAQYVDGSLSALE